ncbi:uncharacterized protein LOC128679544 isoform X2 [Plodia interpunctella]|nr:uncharacterized protein LOC128679544 isoform X2 [Plodia interpunctella]XP_053617825.1 uncharacterized protein LOC128679544 isoform X2 [Plodia interpunctella]XP_053617826.1 uncharacterized protein LOC128679544 isoform X2 [Plodia interpunctella]
MCKSSAEFVMFPGFDATPSSNTWTNRYHIEQFVDEIDETFHTTTTKKPENKSTTLMPDFDCPENEIPINIGTYEVPTQRDLVLLVRKNLNKKFHSYNRKAMYLLRDIKEASKAANLLANKCAGKKDNYRKCVKKVKYHSTTLTKKLMSTVEDHKRNITFFTHGNVCNMAEMAIDPLVLLKMLAAEEITLNFALPAFLRLFSDCRVHCRINLPPGTVKKPKRRLTDQAFLVKHILANSVKHSKINKKSR